MWLEPLNWELRESWEQVLVHISWDSSEDAGTRSRIPGTALRELCNGNLSFMPGNKFLLIGRLQVLH